MVVSSSAVVWHDLECGSYAADLPLWRELASAAQADGPAGARAHSRTLLGRWRSSTSARAPAAWRSTSRATAIA